MADDVKKSDVLSEPAGEAGAEPTKSTDTQKSVDPGSVQKKKKVRRKPAEGESVNGGEQDLHSGNSDTEGKEIRRVRKKRKESAQNGKTQAEGGTEPKKKKVHIKKADPHVTEEPKAVKKTDTDTEGEKKQAGGEKKAVARKADADTAGQKKANGGEKKAAARKAGADTVGEKKATRKGKKLPAKRAVKTKEEQPAASKVPEENAPKENIPKKVLLTAKDTAIKIVKKIPERHRKRVLVTLGAVLGVYLFFTIVFSFIFMPRTYLNGIKVSFKSYVSSGKMIKPLIDDYVLTVHNLDGSQDIVEGSTVHLKYESMKWIKEALRKQNQFAWPASFFKKNEITVEEDISYDTDKFENILEKLSGFRTTTMIEPQDAHVAMDETGNYVVYPEVLGTTIDVKAAEDAARECLLTNNPTLVLEDYHVLPKVYSKDEKLGTRLREWNEYMKSAGLTYLFWDTPEVLTREIINDLISDDAEELYVDEDKVMHLMAVWADRHDSLGRSFTFRTYDGYDVQIASGGDYGYELNEEAVAKDIIEKLNAHDTGSYEVSYWRKPLFPTNNGLGDTYIEVSLSDQHLWMYNNGQLVIDTPVVTGRPTDEGDRITHKGCYSVDWHDTNVTLGTMETRGYEQHVKYWIAFNESEGIHDATWREDAEFGGDTYLYNGSHGCVNTPISAMSIIYDMVIDGEAVVVY